MEEIVVKVEIPEDLTEDVEKSKSELSESIKEFISGIIKRRLLFKKIDESLNDSQFTEEDADKLGELAKHSRIKDLESQGII